MGSSRRASETLARSVTNVEVDVVQQAVLRCVPVFCVCRWSPESFPRPSGRRQLVLWERLHHVFTSHIWESWLSPGHRSFGTTLRAGSVVIGSPIACVIGDRLLVLPNALVALGSGLLCARPFAFIGQRQRAIQIDSCWTSWHHEGPRRSDSIVDIAVVGLETFGAHLQVPEDPGLLETRVAITWRSQRQDISVLMDSLVVTQIIERSCLQRCDRPRPFWRRRVPLENSPQIWVSEL